MDGLDENGKGTEENTAEVVRKKGKEPSKDE